MSRAPAGLVTDWIEFSAVDGPGNRFVLFQQGCTFDCLSCHNPYTINPCVDCGDCVPVCPTQALSVDAVGRVVWDAGACDGTDRCIEVCPYDSTPKARVLEVARVLDAIRPAAPFLSGVTVSGGEATMQASFLRALFDALAADPALGRLTRFVDTNGDAPRATWDLLAPVLDAAMVDLKALDADVHRALTGADNAATLASIELLASRGQLYEVRLLMLPGHNDSADQLARTGDWLAAVDPRLRVKVIGYRAHGVRPTPVPLRTPTREQLESYADQLRARGDFELVLV